MEICNNECMRLKKTKEIEMVLSKRRQRLTQVVNLVQEIL